MTDGLYSIIAYLGANYALIGSVALAYFVWREVGAAAVGGMGQLFVNAGSLSSHQLPSEAAQSCTDVVILMAILPAVLFAGLPTAYNEISKRRGRNSDLADIMTLSALFFAGAFANSFVLALLGAPGAVEAVIGPFLLSVILGSVAITTGKLNRDVLKMPEPATGGSGSDASEHRSPMRPARVLNSQEGSDQEISGSPLATPVYSNSSSSFVPATRQVSTRSRPVVASPTYLFNRNEFFIFRAEHLKDLEDLLRREPPGVLEGLQFAICRRLGRVPVESDERGFVQAYVAQFRKRLEAPQAIFFVPDRLEAAAA